MSSRRADDLVADKAFVTFPSCQFLEEGKLAALVCPDGTGRGVNP